MPLRKAKLQAIIFPNAADPLFSSVGLLCPFKQDFNDHSGAARNLTSDGATLSTSQSKFGSQSLQLTTKSFLAFRGAIDLNLSADFLIESWVYQTDRPTEFAPILECLNGTGYSFALRNGRVNFYDYQTDHTGNAAIALNEWHHIAVWRRSNILSLWIDGVPDAVFNNSRNITTSGNYRIGSNSWSVVPNFWFTGFIQDLRLTKISRPPILPTQPFPTN